MRQHIRNTAMWWTKLLFGAGALIAIFYLIEPREILSAFTHARPAAFAVAVALLAPNVWLQFRKWRYLLRLRHDALSDAVIWSSLFSGFAFGIVTPARVGEFGGRLLPDKRFQNAETLSLVAVDKFAAMTVTVTLGLVAIAVWGYHFGWYGFLPAMGITLAALSVPWLAWLLLQKAGKLGALERRNGYIVRFLIRLAESSRTITARDFRVLLFYSAAFYATFITQFVILLSAFGGVDILYAALGAACVMVAKTVVPPITLGELGIREGFSVFFLTMTGIAPAAAISASLLLFAINILLPAATGGLLLLRSTVQPRLQE